LDLAFLFQDIEDERTLRKHFKNVSVRWLRIKFFKERHRLNYSRQPQTSKVEARFSFSTGLSVWS
jgi:hypothetical protein